MLYFFGEVKLQVKLNKLIYINVFILEKLENIRGEHLLNLFSIFQHFYLIDIHA